MIYNFHLFDGNGNCLFSLNKEEKEDITKLLYGFLYSLKSFGQRIAPILMRDSNFMTYTTNSYQLVFYEMPTSVKFVLIVNPDPSRTNEFYKQLLRELHKNVYVEYVVKNPIQYKNPVDSLLFREKIVEFFSRL